MYQEELDIKVKVLNDKIKLPQYATAGSSGLDLCACIDEPILLKPGECRIVPTGISVKMPNKYCTGLVFARSGLSSKYGIAQVNGVGVIDSDYVGEIKCPIINFSNEDFEIKPGDRIAQIVFMPIAIANLIQVEELGQTDRGTGGFGSTGV